jgi:maleylacetoacetate isomerase
MTIRLYDYWRSSAAYRVRIALEWKGLAYERVATDLAAGAQREAGYKAVNPQGFVPALEIDGQLFTQSLAIFDVLDARFKEPPLVSDDPDTRAHQLAMALVIAADIHPVNNLRVLQYLTREMGQDQDAVNRWYRHWITEGLAALEAMADADAPFLGGEQPAMPDMCLVPQMFNARRFETPLDAFPKLVAIDARCTEIEAFKRAHPDLAKPAE